VRASYRVDAARVFVFFATSHASQRGDSEFSREN
jgi:hypothetical protein